MPISEFCGQQERRRSSDAIPPAPAARAQGPQRGPLAQPRVPAAPQGQGNPGSWSIKMDPGPRGAGSQDGRASRRRRPWRPLMGPGGWGGDDQSQGLRRPEGAPAPWAAHLGSRWDPWARVAVLDAKGVGEAAVPRRPSNGARAFLPAPQLHRRTGMSALRLGAPSQTERGFSYPRRGRRPD